MATKEVSVDALPAGRVDSLQKLHNNVSPGRFLRGQHGITHFRFDEPKQASSRARVAVLSHGLGTSSKIYEGPIVNALLGAGFRVLRYDFLCHGWSHARESWIHYNKDVFLTSLNELLDHVLKPGEPIDLWVGHSTGGNVGVWSATSKSHPIRELAMISPALWIKKPLIAKVADKIPHLMHGLIKNTGLTVLPKNAYLENNDNAFGKKGNEYLFPQTHKEAEVAIKKMYELNPQVVEGILGIGSFFLREDCVTECLDRFKELTKMEGTDAPRIAILWGRYDIVVPFERSRDVLSWSTPPGRVTIIEMEAGHESPMENPELIAKELLKFTQVQSRM